MTKKRMLNLMDDITQNVKRVFGNKTIRAIAFAFLFLVSGIGASIVVPASAASKSAAAPMSPALPGAALSQAEANWQYANGNAFNQDYNSINQINASNIPYLSLSWLYPLPDKPTSLIPVTALGGVGVNMQLLIVNGTAYGMTNYDQIFAFNLANGNVLWTYLIPLMVNESIPGAGVARSTGPIILALHQHDGNEWFTTAPLSPQITGPTLWYQAADQKVFAINALTGKPVLNFSTYTGRSMIPGMAPTSTYHAVSPSNIVIDQKRGILVSSIDTEISADNGRGFYAGWNLKVNPPKLIWLAFLTPPQPGGNLPVDANWAMKSVNNMTQGASIFFPGKGAANGYTTPTELQGGVMMNTNDNIVVNLKTMSPSQLNATLYNDWGQAQQSQQCLAIDGGGSTGSTGPAWGGPWLLGTGPTDGIVYAGSNNKDPFMGPCNPGPDLWSAAVLALNITNGHWVWGFQTIAHDIWDYDCSWWQAAGNETINGVNTPVIFKTCKDGFLYELNALTGHLIWAWVPPTNIVPRCTYCWPMDPTNKTQMSFDAPSAFTTFKTQPTTGAQPNMLLYPFTAGFEDEQAYNPKTNTLFVVSHITPAYMIYDGLNASTYYTSTGYHSTPLNNPKFGGTPSNNNSTVWAINGATGAINWHYFIPLTGFRGAVTLTGSLVLVPISSGDILILDQATGKLVRDYYVGAPMDVAASVGATSTGQEYIILPVGTCGSGSAVACPGTTPGDIVALTLMNVPPPGGTTATVTTTVQAGGGGAVTTTVTTTAGGGGATTTTVTGTGGGGIDPTVTYGIAAVAVIFIIATGFLAMRGRRKPAP